MSTLNTGFNNLDSLISGLNKRELIVLGSRPAMGKTYLALNIAKHVAEAYGKVLFFSLDLPEGSLLRKLNDIFGLLEKPYEAKLYMKAVPSHLMREIKEDCLKMEAKPNLIIIDYFQLINSNVVSRKKIRRRNKAIAMTLKQLATDMNCPVIVLSQLSRDVECRNDHRPRLSDLKPAKPLERYADKILLLYRDEYYHPIDSDFPFAYPKTMEISLVKSPVGLTGVTKLSF